MINETCYLLDTWYISGNTKCRSGCFPITLPYCHCQLVDGPSEVLWGGGGGERGGTSTKTIPGCSSNISGMISATFRILGSKTTDISFLYFESRIGLESRIPSIQCEKHDKAEHIRPIQKIISLCT